jgi:hypothetical protein
MERENLGPGSFHDGVYITDQPFTLGLPVRSWHLLGPVRADEAHGIPGAGKS